MRLFEFSGKFEQNGKWSTNKDDFIGYFLKRSEKTNVIEGYICCHCLPITCKIRFIKGMYLESLGKLVFLQLPNDARFSPLLYTFNDIHKEGFWDSFDSVYGFFNNGNYLGHATISIHEIVDRCKLHIMLPQVYNTYMVEFSNALIWNRQHLEQLDILPYYLKSPYYPQE